MVQVRIYIRWLHVDGDAFGGSVIQKYMSGGVELVAGNDAQFFFERKVGVESAVVNESAPINA